MIRKHFFRMIIFLILFPFGVAAISLITAYIPISGESNPSQQTKEIFISTNGVHVNIIMHRQDMDSVLLSGLLKSNDDQYFSFGWGDRAFYLETPEWKDLTASNAFNALFFETPSLMHVSRYHYRSEYWIAIPISPEQLKTLSHEINATFFHDEHLRKMKIPNASYGYNDEFYEAIGSYHLFYTCNTWANITLRNAGLESCLWTLFDFPLMDLYQ